ncbi:hypothetical protein EI94DRAFT_1780663 [Lactarius quietus]|nr:hypothetical protein EI94DRAFT_1780663 [Lactarius quietus]
MAQCKGCRREGLKRSGILHHCNRSRNPRCKAYLAQLKSVEKYSLPTLNISSATMDGQTISEYSPIPTLNVSLAAPEMLSTSLSKKYAGQDDDMIDLEPEYAISSNTAEANYDATYINMGDEDDDDDIAACVAQDESALEPCRSPSHLNEDKDPLQVTNPLPNQGEVDLDLERHPIFTQYPGGMAGTIHSKAKLNENERYGLMISSQSEANIYAPFTSSLEWEVARWAKIRGPSLTSFTELMAIEGEILVGNEVCKVYFRDILRCIGALFRDPDFVPHLIFAPEKHYASEEKRERVYHDMHTGAWWWKTQAAVEKVTPGATIVPVLILTDKTQLTTFRNKSTYLIYMTIGNILKTIRRKTSSHAYLLLGYLPTTKLEQETNKAKKKRLMANLYHACMRHILTPLSSAGQNGVYMSTAAGEVYRTHPIFMSFIGDYPEQVLTTCTLTGDCPRCGTTNDNLGDFGPGSMHDAHNLDEALSMIDSFHVDPAQFLQASSRIHMKPVPNPFWLDLPHTNIYRSITPDVLHQLYQGIIKHLKMWILTACDPAEIDARCQQLPPNHHIRLFMKGISSLSRVTGQEHDQICRFLLGILIDIWLPNNLSNLCFLRATCAILNFLYLSQYPIHTNTTLRLLMESLTRFHFRTTDNFNTQVAGARVPTHIVLDLQSMDTHSELSMAKHPSQPAVSLEALEVSYGAPLFKVALRRFISCTKDQSQSRQQLERSLWQQCLPFTRLPVWHVLKFTRTDPVNGAQTTTDSIHVQPAKYNKANRFIPGHFNTALINDGNGDNVGRVRVVFSIPTRYHKLIFGHGVTVPHHLAYVQWYVKLAEPDQNHGMIKLCPQKDSDSNWVCSIVPVANIQWSVHLLPKFGPVVPAEWTSSNVLDRCETFFMNTYTD